MEQESEIALRRRISCRGGASQQGDGEGRVGAYGVVAALMEHGEAVEGPRVAAVGAEPELAQGLRHVGALPRGAAPPRDRRDRRGRCQESSHRMDGRRGRHLGRIVTRGTSISCIEMPPCWKVPV